MAMKKGKGPAPAALDPKVTKKLLDLLSTDNEFRRLFKKDAHAALLNVGYKPSKTRPPETGLKVAIPSVAGQCLQMRPTDSIAPKAKIIRERAKMEKAFSSVFGFMCPAGLKAD